MPCSSGGQGRGALPSPSLSVLLGEGGSPLLVAVGMSTRAAPTAACLPRSWAQLRLALEAGRPGHGNQSPGCPRGRFKETLARAGCPQPHHTGGATARPGLPSASASSGAQGRVLAVLDSLHTHGEAIGDVEGTGRPQAGSTPLDATGGPAHGVHRRETGGDWAS